MSERIRAHRRPQDIHREILLRRDGRRRDERPGRPGGRDPGRIAEAPPWGVGQADGRTLERWTMTPADKPKQPPARPRFEVEARFIHPRVIDGTTGEALSLE